MSLGKIRNSDQATAREALRDAIERSWRLEIEKVGQLSGKHFKLHEPTFGVDEILAAVDCMLTSYVTMGKRVAELERIFAEFIGVPEGISCNSGSSANLLAIGSLANRQTEDGLRPGDEVIGCPECRTPPDVPGTFLYEDGGPAYEVPPSYFLIRGDPFSSGSEMQPGFLSVATYGDPPTAISRPGGRTSGRRLALAEWITSRDNPLTARVAVNRIWHHHFGRGIVRTLDNLGKMGELPTHPELLDWLAVEFMDRGWSVNCLLYTSPSPRDGLLSRMPSSA